MEEDKGIIGGKLQKQKDLIDLYIAEMKTELSNFSTSISGLSNYYKGPGATALKTCYADVKSCYPALFLALNNGSNYLSTVINGYDSEDTNISDSINSLPN